MPPGETPAAFLFGGPVAKRQQGLDLFDLLEQEDVKTNPEVCSHRVERYSETVWPGELKVRFTMTCELCGRVRGRYPKEPNPSIRH